MTTPTLSHCLNLLLLRTSTHLQKNSNLNWFLRCKGFKNFAIWLAESIYSMPRYAWTKKIIFWYFDNILDYNSRTRFFQGWLNCWQKPKSPIFRVFSGFFSQKKIFSENPTLSFLSLDHPTSCTISEKSYVPFWRKRDYWLTYIPTGLLLDSTDFIAFHLKVWVQKALSFAKKLEC